MLRGRILHEPGESQLSSSASHPEAASLREEHLPVRASSLLVIKALGGFYSNSHVCKDLPVGAESLCIQFFSVFQLEGKELFLLLSPCPYTTGDQGLGA